MSLRGSITYVGSPDATVRELRRAAKPELEETINYWHETYTPGHFKPEATQKYGYKIRSSRYRKYKMKAHGHDDPLVFTGDAERQILRAIKVTSTSKGGKGVMDAPSYFYAYQKQFNQPDKADEVARTTKKETTDMALRLDKRITKRLNSVKERKVIQV